MIAVRLLPIIGAGIILSTFLKEGISGKIGKYFYYTFPRDFFKICVVSIAFSACYLTYERAFNLETVLKVNACFFALIATPRIIQQIYFETKRDVWVVDSQKVIMLQS